MSNLADKSLQKIETYTLCSITFCRENRAVDEVTWKMVQPAWPQMTT